MELLMSLTKAINQLISKLMKTQNLIYMLLLVCLFYSSCSSSDANNDCSGTWYYVYTVDDCECITEDSSCRTYHLINKEIYACLENISIDSCFYIDNSICAEIDFSGYLVELGTSCFKIDRLI